jgi:hypothetical protein
LLKVLDGLTFDQVFFTVIRGKIVILLSVSPCKYKRAGEFAWGISLQKRGYVVDGWRDRWRYGENGLGMI